ncbi:putative ubiquitin fusion degradation protein UFD1 [Rosa chinensis]|uniref:Putative ubiquitin fusion degradation protein UFD1 n=1 Tax=Rosa chinensis TaxID=74649 RepID=A0A2P6PAU8_ROSCH|nr:ubiquitin recognition factor in ER-associated degradation protein 1 [Rosa chinensis]PRQ19048.1 putative ubiquitin fusion degradation protein UFD1 [Rosa chinensis]
MDLNENGSYDSDQTTYYSADSGMSDDEIGSDMGFEDDKAYEVGSDMSITDGDGEIGHSEPSYGGHEYDDFVGTTPFWHRYHCYPASKTEKHAYTESSDKIIMPPSALDVLASLNIGYPMLFEFRPYSFDAAENNETEKFRVSHCGVWEFTAEEGFVYMPNWMMENMNLKEGDLVLLQNQTLPKGSHVKLQPHTKDFLDIPDPKAMLEAALGTFSCLTTGDTIVLPYENKKYYMDIIETKPSDAIGIIDTDCEVDFAPPLDYKEPEKPVASSIPLNKEADGQVDKPKFSPFKGTGRRLDGKPLQYESALDSSSFVATNGNPQPCTESSSRATRRRVQGKLVFGADTAPKVASKEVKQQQQLQEKEEPKFLAFTGKMYSLT